MWKAKNKSIVVWGDMEMTVIWFIIGIIIIYAAIKSIAMVFDNKKQGKQTRLGLTFLAFIVGGTIIVIIVYFVDK